MNFKNKLILILSIFFIRLSAQEVVILRGYVTDTLHAPLPFANVFTQVTDSTAMLAYGITDDKGFFSFETPKLKKFIAKVTAMGYETKSIIVDEDKITEDLKFSLAPQDFILKEVIIKGSNKIVQRSDTITFNADKFRDSTERNLEELLAKLPGVEIDKNSGVISVQGKPIKKILIEGDDLTGRNYQLMSKNMAADVVDKIQIIDKFTGNKLLKGIKRSDDKVLNITLKESRKKLLFGNIVLGLGNDKRTNNSLNLFGFYKKLKTISFGNFNTTGQISTADRMVDSDFMEETSAEEQHSIVNTNNPLLINVGNTPSLSLNSQSVRFNKATLASTHFTLRPIETVSLKGSITFSNDFIRSYIGNNFRYLLGDTLFQLNETQNLQNKPSIFETHLEAQFDLSTKSLLRYKGDFRKSSLTNSTQTIANENFIDNILKNKGLSMAHTLDFTHRINEKNALTATAFFINQTNNQVYQLTQTLPRSTPSVFGGISSYADAFSQNVEKPMQYFVINTQWLYSKDKLKIATSIGLVSKNEDLLSRFSAFDKRVILADSVQNNSVFTQKNYYIGLNIKTEWLGLEWFSDVSTGVYHTFFDKNRSKKGLYALPILGFKKAVKDSKHTLLGTYGYTYGLPQFLDLFTGFVLTDYRNIERGSNFYIPENTHTGIANYTYGNFSDDFLFYVNAIYSVRQKGYRSDLVVNSDFNTTNKVENTFLYKTTMLSGGFERYMPNLSMRLKLKPSVSVGNYPNTLNGSAIRETQVVNNALDISLRTAYLKWFNFHMGSTMTQTNVKTTIDEALNRSKNETIGGYLDVYLKFGKKMSGKIENEIFNVKQYNTTKQRYYFMNASMNYSVIQAKLDINLYGRNLLNTKAFINSFITDYSSNINRIDLLPRYILLEMNYRF